MAARLTKAEKAEICRLRDKHKLPTQKIAAVIERDPATVYRFLERIQPNNEHLQRFKRGETDCMALKKMLRTSIQVEALEYLKNSLPEVLPHMMPNQITTMDKDMSISSGVDISRGIDLQRVNITINNNYFDLAVEESKIDRQLSALGIDPAQVLDAPQDAADPAVSPLPE